MSETTNLKLFKHDNPSTNTNPFDVEQALNDNWNKIDTAVGDLQDDIKENNTNITNIDTRLTTAETDLETAKTDITNIKAEQTTQNNNIKANSTAIETNAEAIEQNKEDITDLQAENANLRAQIPTGQESREEISLSDSAEMELVDFGLQGNSYQQNEPTLENLSEVQAVGDNINIFDDTAEKVTSTINDNGIEVPDSGTNDYYKQIIIPDSKKYIMSYKKNNQSFVRMAYYNGDTFISRQYSNQNGFIFTVPDNCNKIDCRTNAGTNNGIKFTDLKIERGEVATSYSLYNQGNIEITNSNKNLLDLGQVSAKGITFNKNRITIINPTYYLYAEKCNLINNKFLSGKSLTLTLIANGNVETNNMAINMGTNKDGHRFQKYFTVGNYDNTKFVITKTLQEDEHITYINVYVPTTALPTCNLTIDLQMEINEASDFIEHKGNTYTLPIQKPFYKIGDYADAFIKQEGKWYEQHYIKDLVLTGNENFVQADTDRFYITNLIVTITNEDAINCISNSFKGDTYANRWTANKVTARTNSLTFCTNSGYTLDTFKAKLQELNAAGTPVKVYYILATPEVIECTKEQTAVLEQIIKDGTFKEVTHFYTTEDLKPTMEVKYYKDLETLFNKQAELENTLNNVQAQLLELGGN